MVSRSSTQHVTELLAHFAVFDRPAKVGRGCARDDRHDWGPRRDLVEVVADDEPATATDVDTAEYSSHEIRQVPIRETKYLRDHRHGVIEPVGHIDIPLSGLTAGEYGLPPAGTVALTVLAAESITDTVSSLKLVT